MLLDSNNFPDVTSLFYVAHVDHADGDIAVLRPQNAINMPEGGYAPIDGGYDVTEGIRRGDIATLFAFQLSPASGPLNVNAGPLLSLTSTLQSTRTLTEFPNTVGVWSLLTPGPGRAEGGDSGGPLFVNGRMVAVLHGAAPSSSGGHYLVSYLLSNEQRLREIIAYEPQSLSVSIPEMYEVVIRIARRLYGDTCGPSNMLRKPSPLPTAKADASCEALTGYRVFYKPASDGDSWAKAPFINVAANTDQVPVKPEPDQPGKVWVFTELPLVNGQPLDAGPDGKPKDGDASGPVIMATTAYTMPPITQIDSRGKGSVVVTWNPSLAAPGKPAVKGYWLIYKKHDAPWSAATWVWLDPPSQGNPNKRLSSLDDGMWDFTVLPQLEDGTILGTAGQGYGHLQTDADGHLESNTYASAFLGPLPSPVNTSALMVPISYLLQ